MEQIAPFPHHLGCQPSVLLMPQTRASNQCTDELCGRVKVLSVIYYKRPFLFQIAGKPPSQVRHELIAAGTYMIVMMEFRAPI